MRRALPLLALVALVSLAGCRSTKPSPSSSPPPSAKGATTITAASATPPAARPAAAEPPSDPLRLLPDDPNWTRSERAVTVLSVSKCGNPSADAMCLSFSLRNDTRETIVEVSYLRLYLYDAAGKKFHPQQVIFLSRPIALEPGATRPLTVTEHGEYNTKLIDSAKNLEAEVTSVRFAGAPKGRTWYNYNLGDEDRPKGGLSAAELTKRAAVPVRASSIDAKGTARLRNDGTEPVRKITVGVARWERKPDGTLRARATCMSRDMAIKLAPGESRDVSLVADDCKAVNFSAHEANDVGTTVSVALLHTARGKFYNANVEYNLGWTRAGEDLAPR